MSGAPAAPQPLRKARTMNVTQFLAWIICLALAFFACVLAARNTGKTAMLERQLGTVQAVATDQTAALRDVTVVLKQIENDLKPGAGQAAFDQLAQ